MFYKIDRFFFFWLIYLRLKGKCRCVIGRNMLSDSHLTLGFILSGHLRYRISHLNWNMLSPCFQNEHEASMTFLIINGKRSVIQLQVNNILLEETILLNVGMWSILSLPYLGSSHVSWVLKTVKQENVVEWARKSLLTQGTPGKLG